jgi:chitodextrinase
VQLAWTAATDNVGVVGYRVYRDGALVGTTTGLTYVDPDLEPQTAYFYEVRAVDAAGNIGSPASATVTTTARTPGYVGPSVPEALAASVQTGRRVRLSWKASASNAGVVAYDVLRNGAMVGTTARTSFVDRPGRGTFTYRVRARDTAGNVSQLSVAVDISL